MARFDEPSKPEHSTPRTKEQPRAWNHVRWVFGRQPGAIRCLSPWGHHPDVCVVEISLNWNNRYKLICSDGLLVGIPPQKKGRI